MYLSSRVFRCLVFKYRQHGTDDDDEEDDDDDDDKIVKDKAVPLQAWSGPEGSRKLRFPDFLTTAQDGGKVVSLTHRPLIPPENIPGTYFC
jgi:hypothetical protein